MKIIENYLPKDSYLGKNRTTSRFLYKEDRAYTIVNFAYGIIPVSSYYFKVLHRSKPDSFSLAYYLMVRAL